MTPVTKAGALSAKDLKPGRLAVRGPRPTVKPRIRAAILYDPEDRGLRLALAYVRVRRTGDRQYYDLYGHLEGYSGGGCYDFQSFHVEGRLGEGFVSYTPANGGGSWGDDSIGVSGLAGQDRTDEVERLLSATAHYLFQWWLIRTEDDPYLRPEAKRRLKCERRQAFYYIRPQASIMAF